MKLIINLLCGGVIQEGTLKNVRKRTSVRKRTKGGGSPKIVHTPKFFLKWRFQVFCACFFSLMEKWNTLKISKEKLKNLTSWKANCFVKHRRSSLYSFSFDFPIYIWISTSWNAIWISCQPFLQLKKINQKRFEYCIYNKEPWNRIQIFWGRRWWLKTYGRLEEVVPQVRIKAFKREGTTKLANLERMCVCNDP